MIERFPEGLVRDSVTSEILTRCARLPAILHLAGRGYVDTFRDGKIDGFAEPDAPARVTTFAAAYLASEGERDAVLRPVNYMLADLSMPPSVNELFVEAAGRRKGRGRQRVKTEKYKGWQNNAGWELKACAAQQGARLDPKDPPFAENFGLWIRADVNHNSDITNRVKAIEDLLVSMGVTIGDQWNDCCVIERDRSIPEKLTRTIIYQIPED